MPNTDRNKAGSSFKERVGRAAQMTREQRASSKRGTAKGRDHVSRMERRAPGRSNSDARRAASGAGRKQAAYDSNASRRGDGTRAKRDARAPKEARKDGAPKKRKGLPSGKARVVLAVLAVIVLCCALVYPLGKGYYHTMREGQRLQAQIDAVNGRNETLQDEADALQTEEGIEAQARDDYNYVKEGERAASVTNAQGSSGSTDLPAQVDEDSIKAPQTWYYTILDVVFFYSD